MLRNAWWATLPPGRAAKAARVQHWNF